LISAPLTLYKKKSNPAFIELTEKNDKGITDYTIQLVPDSFGFGTKIIWSTRTSLLSWLENKFNHRHNNSISGQNLNAFRMFAESPKRFFGFDIQIRPVEDTLVMTNYSTCQKASVTHTLKSLYFKIENLAIKYNIYIDSNRNRLAAFEFKGRDSVIVMAGIPVKKKFLPVNGVSYLEMPPKGRMLVGYYEGPYQKISQLYVAMDKFARIRSLSKIATPFEKYLTSPVTASDSLHIKIELFYPIL
ncbi:MAG: hypothetical protein JST13_06250, partial [Bacteroidetes bacterium]|nr:hypothetical protein [Bacteroidota bacterium]